MNYLLWALGALAIGLGIGMQWFFWTGSDLPALSAFRRRTTFIRRTFANALIVGVGLVLFAIPAAHDQRWQLIALSAIVALLLVVMVLAAWDWIAINVALRNDRDNQFHEQLRAELLDLQKLAKTTSEKSEPV